MRDAERLAVLLVGAYSGAALSAADVGAGPADRAAAYRIQDLVLRALAGAARPTAWKVSPPQAGAEPLASPVLPAAVLRSPCERKPRPGLLGVEAEIAFRLDRHLEAEEAFVLIELCETRLADWQGAPALMKLADFQSNGAFVLGSGKKDWRGLDFATQRVELWVNGERRLARTGTHPSGDPAALVPWGVRIASARGGLRAGDVITTGSWIGMAPVAAGDEVEVRFPGIGEARLRL